MHIEPEYTTFLLQDLQQDPSLTKNYPGVTSLYFYFLFKDNIDDPNESIFINKLEDNLLRRI